VLCETAVCLQVNAAIILKLTNNTTSKPHASGKKTIFEFFPWWFSSITQSEVNQTLHLAQNRSDEKGVFKIIEAQMVHLFFGGHT